MQYSKLSSSDKCVSDMILKNFEKGGKGKKESKKAEKESKKAEKGGKSGPKKAEIRRKAGKNHVWDIFKKNEGQNFSSKMALWSAKKYLGFFLRILTFNKNSDFFLTNSGRRSEF